MTAEVPEPTLIPEFLVRTYFVGCCYFVLLWERGRETEKGRKEDVGWGSGSPRFVSPRSYGAGRKL